MADMYLGNESGGFDLVGTTNIKNIDFEEVKISKEDYENLSEEERKTGIHLVTGLDDTENGGGSADLISYDNTNSGLGSTNVQGAIDELNKNLKWKLLGTTVGDINSSTYERLTLPNNFNELNVTLFDSEFIYTWHILKENLPTTEMKLRQGSANDCWGWIYLSQTEIRAHSTYTSGEYTTPTMTVYYR